MTSLTKAFSCAVVLASVTGAALPAAAAEKSVCTTRNANAALRTIYPADPPPLAEIARMSGTAVVQFDLDARGVASNPSIVKSTGYGVLDNAAKRAALAQDYVPEIHDCEAVAGSYRIVIEYPAS